jgi:hypothetical protein
VAGPIRAWRRGCQAFRHYQGGDDHQHQRRHPAAERGGIVAERTPGQHREHGADHDQRPEAAVAALRGQHAQHGEDDVDGHGEGPDHAVGPRPQFDRQVAEHGIDRIQQVPAGINEPVWPDPIKRRGQDKAADPDQEDCFSPHATALDGCEFSPLHYA